MPTFLAHDDLFLVFSTDVIQFFSMPVAEEQSTEANLHG